MEPSRNAWLTVSANEWAASASSAVDPLTRPPASLTTAITALATSATITVRLLAPTPFRERSRLRRLVCRGLVTRQAYPLPRAEQHLQPNAQLLGLVDVALLQQVVGETPDVVAGLHVGL